MLTPGRMRRGERRTVGEPPVRSMSETAPVGRVSVPLPAVAVVAASPGTWDRLCRCRSPLRRNRTPVQHKMTKFFNYNVGSLIELVESRPCLWDKTADSFRDRTQRQRAWNEICVALEKDYHRKDKRERKRIAEAVTVKWHNVRDAFVKSLKKMYGHPSRKYIYYDQLQFLIKVVRRNHTSDEEQTTSVTTRNSDGGCSKRARLQDDIDQEILKALKNTKSDPDEDEAFFMSLTPTVRRMCQEDKLEFRMGVLQLIKNITSREIQAPTLSSNSSSPKLEELDEETLDFK